jgi:hypothetical protein
MRLAAATAGSFAPMAGRGVLAELTALRSAWQVGSFGVSAHAASFALASAPRLGLPA